MTFSKSSQKFKYLSASLSLISIMNFGLLCPQALAQNQSNPGKNSLSYDPSDASDASDSAAASDQDKIDEAKKILQSMPADKLKRLAQLTPQLKTGSPSQKLPTVSGTVEIRKPFKLFAQQSLIHHLSFRDTPVREVISEIARRGKLNIIIDKSVNGKVTGELRDVTLNEAMDSVRRLGPGLLKNGRTTSLAARRPHERRGAVPVTLARGHVRAKRRRPALRDAASRLLGTGLLVNS